jgi:hypothetical protein
VKDILSSLGLKFSDLYDKPVDRETLRKIHLEDERKAALAAREHAYRLVALDKSSMWQEVTNRLGALLMTHDTDNRLDYLFKYAMSRQRFYEGLARACGWKGVNAQWDKDKANLYLDAAISAAILLLTPQSKRVKEFAIWDKANGPIPDPDVIVRGVWKCRPPDEYVLHPYHRDVPLLLTIHFAFPRAQQFCPKKITRQDVGKEIAVRLGIT